MMARFLVELSKTDACKGICVIQKIFSMWTNAYFNIVCFVSCDDKNVNIFIVFIVLKLIGLLSHLRSLL